MAAKCISLALALMAFLFLSNVESKRFRLQERILGGVTAAKGQFPYMVSLINRQNEFPVCGGAIINNFYTVSSAYCVDAYKTYPELLVLYLGAWKLRETVFRDVDKVRLHPQYNASTKQNDIALLRTKNKIVFSNLLKPISLPTENFPNENGEKLIVSGFGLWFNPTKVHDTSVRASTLLYDETITLSRELCIERYSRDSLYPEAQYINENVMCTSNSLGKGLCLGDRGNPLVTDDKLVAIASWCVECSSNYPNIYTKIFPYLEWIRNVTSA